MDEIVVTISPSGEVVFDWWCPKVEEIIEAFDVQPECIKVLVPWIVDGRVVRLCG